MLFLSKNLLSSIFIRLSQEDKNFKSCRFRDKKKLGAKGQVQWLAELAWDWEVQSSIPSLFPRERGILRLSFAAFASFTLQKD